ncbi:MAG: rhomboid family intramembrane serine protease [Planctomycetota bacterium]
MGIYDRDYYGDGPRPGLFSTHPITRGFMAACGAVWLLQLVTMASYRSAAPGSGGATDWLDLSFSDAATGQVWRFVTYAFCHDTGGFLHILFNLLFLWWFGTRVEDMRGARETVWFYAVAAVCGGVGAVVVQRLMGQPDIGVIGASGVVMAVVAFYAMTYPYERIYLFFGLFPIELRFLFIFYVVTNFLPLLLELLGKWPPSGTSHAAHVGGLSFGFLYYRYAWTLSEKYEDATDRVRTAVAAKRSGLKIHKPSVGLEDEPSAPADPFADRVDAILEKISREGEASLTDDERSHLEEASRRYRR